MFRLIDHLVSKVSRSGVFSFNPFPHQLRRILMYFNGRNFERIIMLVHPLFVSPFRNDAEFIISAVLRYLP
jgi:hypothetical protein